MFRFIYTFTKRLKSQSLFLSILLAVLVYRPEERASQKTRLGQTEGHEALSPRQTQSRNHSRHGVSSRAHIQVDRDRLAQGRVRVGLTPIKIDDIADLLAVGAFHDPVVSVEGLGVPAIQNK